jgi:streptogramin lyase
MKPQHTIWRTLLASAFIVVLAFVVASCDPFADDGVSSGTVGIRSGYFYLLDRTSASIVMLDPQLSALKKWSLVGISSDSSLQGIASDGKNLWVSCAGSTDKIFQLDATGDSLTIIKSFDAPPQGRGTVRAIAWDGSSLWALNSGSTTSSIPATLYRLNPTDGSILAEYPVPSPEPRGLTYARAYSDVYGRGSEAGIYYTDVTKNAVYRFRTDRPQFDSVFASPTPPRGISYNYPVGIAHDGTTFWVVNSSNTADHLFQLDYSGRIINRYDLPYREMGPIVWTPVDVRIPIPPAVLAVNPNSGVRGATLDVQVIGSGFRTGATVSFGAGVQVVSSSVTSQTQIRTTVTIELAATLGKRNVTVTLPGGVTATGDTLFAVTALPQIPYLWVADQASGQFAIHKIRVSDTTLVQSWPTTIVSSGSPQGLAFDGTNVWLCASGTDRKLYRLDTSGPTLSAISSIPAPTASGTLRGIVWDNGSLWLAISNPSKLYKLNPTTGAVLDSVNAPGTEPRGIVFANGNLYCNDTNLDSVYVLNAANRTWSSVFQTPTTGTASRFATGLTWDGTSFWIANSTTNSDYLFKVPISGTPILQSFRPSITGDPQLTGLLYTTN